MDKTYFVILFDENGKDTVYLNESQMKEFREFARENNIYYAVATSN